MIITILILIVLTYLVSSIIESIISKRNNTFDTYFGIPGSGKTTFSAWLSKKYQKRKINVFSTLPLIGAFEITKEDIGEYDISNGLILWDEAGIDLDNRNFKTNFTPQQVKFLKYHRHFNVDIAVFSQYWNDIDIKIRNLTTRLFLVEKSFFPFFITRREISKKIGIDELTKQVIDEYYFPLFGRKRIFAPSLYKLFNSHSTYELPPKEFRKYDEIS